MHKPQIKVLTEIKPSLRADSTSSSAICMSYIILLNHLLRTPPPNLAVYLSSNIFPSLPHCCKCCCLFFQRPRHPCIYSHTLTWGTSRCLLITPQHFRGATPAGNDEEPRRQTFCLPSRTMFCCCEKLLNHELSHRELFGALLISAEH